MADTTSCPHCQEPIPRVRQTQRCPHCGKIVLIKPLAASGRPSASRTPKFWQQMSLFQGEVLVARIVLIVLAFAAALALLIGC